MMERFMVSPSLLMASNDLARRSSIFLTLLYDTLAAAASHSPLKARRITLVVCRIIFAPSCRLPLTVQLFGQLAAPPPLISCFILSRRARRAFLYSSDVWNAK